MDSSAGEPPPAAVRPFALVFWGAFGLYGVSGDARRRERRALCRTSPEMSTPGHPTLRPARKQSISIDDFGKAGRRQKMPALTNNWDTGYGGGFFSRCLLQE